MSNTLINWVFFFNKKRTKKGLILISKHLITKGLVMENIYKMTIWLINVFFLFFYSFFFENRNISIPNEHNSGQLDFSKQIVLTTFFSLNNCFFKIKRFLRAMKVKEEFFCIWANSLRFQQIFFQFYFSENAFLV